MEILHSDDRQAVLAKFYEVFKFYPSVNQSIVPFQIEQSHEIFYLQTIWNKRQERIASKILSTVGCNKMYALDWQHDCFLYNPCRERPYGKTWINKEDGFRVYFPSLYPNGDYYFFITEDFSYGMLGHPWRKEIWVLGQKLIQMFEQYKAALELREKPSSATDLSQSTVSGNSSTAPIAQPENSFLHYHKMRPSEWPFWIESQPGPTPHGGCFSVALYSNRTHVPCKKKDAYFAEIHECDENGNSIARVYMERSQ